MLILGVVLGSLIQERSNESLLINAGLFVAVFTGGVVTGYRSRYRPLMAGTLSASPAIALAVIVQIVRWVNDSGPVPWLGLPLAALLTASLGTLGGLLGARFSPLRHSLFNS